MREFKTVSQNRVERFTTGFQAYRSKIGDRMDSRFVLVADDDQACRDVLVVILRMFDIPVLTAADGFEAFEVTMAKRPRLIFMDLNMPNMDGLDATRAIYRHAGNLKIPIIAMSAQCHGERWQAFKDSCVHWLE